MVSMRPLRSVRVSHAVVGSAILLASFASRQRSFAPSHADTAFGPAAQVSVVNESFPFELACVLRMPTQIGSGSFGLFSMQTTPTTTVRKPVAAANPFFGRWRRRCRRESDANGKAVRPCSKPAIRLRATLRTRRQSIRTGHPARSSRRRFSGSAIDSGDSGCDHGGIHRRVVDPTQAGTVF